MVWYIWISQCTISDCTHWMPWNQSPQATSRYWNIWKSETAIYMKLKKKNTASLVCLRSIENGKFGCLRCFRWVRGATHAAFVPFDPAAGCASESEKSGASMTGWRDDSWLEVGSDQLPLWIVRLGLYNSINCPVDWECGPYTNQYNKIIKGWRWWRRVLKTHMAPFPLWHFGWSCSGTN